LLAVREQVRRWRSEGRRVAFVPTMGNLHAGHVSLIEAARRHGDRFVASIFVNPMQFGPNEDFAHYPRTPTQDERMLARSRLQPDVHAGRGGDLSERFRARHACRCSGPVAYSGWRVPSGPFRGREHHRATLFHIVEPDVAIFGEKDFQQLTIIRRMVADLCMPVEIVGAPTVRDADGLAMSSRNQYLAPPERAIAPRIYETLQAAAQRLGAGDVDFASIERTGVDALTKGHEAGLLRGACGNGFERPQP
jgi:pantoate--beta-alanine ligase